MKWSREITHKFGHGFYVVEDDENENRELAIPDLVKKKQIENE